MIRIVLRHISIFLLVFFLGTQVSIAQRLTTELINSKDGLSNNVINDIFQDSQGFLWIATNDGLNRFDGYEYLVFRKDVYDTLSIGSGMVNSIAEDQEGDLWVGTDKGISRMDIETCTFENFSFGPPKIGSLPNKTFDLFFDREWNLWCLLSDRVIQYRPESNTFSEFPIPQKYIIPRNESLGSLAYHKASGTILVGTASGLVYLKENYREIRVSAIQDVKINDILISENDILWVATSDGFVKCGKTDNPSILSSCEYVMKGVEIKGLVNDVNDNLILLTDKDISLYNQETEKVINHSYFSIPGSDIVPNIRTCIVDISMNLWVGTQKGICRADLKSMRFDYYSKDINKDVVLSNDIVSAISGDDKNLYCGYWNKGVEVINMETLTSKYYPGEGVNRIFIDSAQRVWILGEEMDRFYPESEKFVSAADEFDFPDLKQMKSSFIYDITQLGDQEFLLSHMNGLYYFNGETGEFRNDSVIYCDTTRLPLYGVTNIVDSKQYIWFSTFSGLVQFNKDRDEYKYFPTDEESGLSGKVISLYADKKERLWVGTPEGLFRFQELDSTFLAYNVKNGFSNDFIYSIEEDDKGMLWMGTNKGIIRFDPDTEDVKNFGVQHGLSAMEFNLNASYYSEEGMLYFGSIEGVNFFNPERVASIDSIAPTRITGAKIFSRENYSFFPSPGSDIEMGDRESLQLFFSIMDHSMPEYNEYMYRLISQGDRGAWISIGAENSLVLSGLTHGKYNFEVKGANSEGGWSKVFTSITIQVVAPIHRRRVFLAIMFLPILLFVFFFFIYRTKTLRRSNRILRDKELAAKEVLKQKNLLSRRNKNIEDSLKYAQRIQNAMFTSSLEIKQMIPESFILQKPKDIVSGDFYWGKKIGSKIFLAAADCTGHGVPGAFMSLIGLEFFRQIVGSQKIYKPSLILDEINRNFDIVFGGDTEINLRDGMDLAFLVIDEKTNILQFSGAVNPLYIIRDGEIIEIKGDRIFLGPDLGFGREKFNNHEFQLQENDMLYMFSDGYVDQFGGPEGKKFKFRRFRHLLMSISDQAVNLQKQVLNNTMKDWMGNHEQVDDILVIGIKPLLKVPDKNLTSQVKGLSFEQDRLPEKVY